MRNMDRAMLTFDLEAGNCSWLFSFLSYHFADVLLACGILVLIPTLLYYRSDQCIRLECQTNIRLRDRKLHYPVQC